MSPQYSGENNQRNILSNTITCGVLTTLNLLCVCGPHFQSLVPHEKKKNLYLEGTQMCGEKFMSRVKAIPLVYFLSSGIPSQVPYNLLVLLLLPHLVMGALCW